MYCFDAEKQKWRLEKQQIEITEPLDWQVREFGSKEFFDGFYGYNVWRQGQVYSYKEYRGTMWYKDTWFDKFFFEIEKYGDPIVSVYFVSLIGWRFPRYRTA